MKNIIARRHVVQTLLSLVLTVSLTSCLNNDDETIVLETPTNNTGIPDDSQADPNPILLAEPTTSVPNIQTTVDYVDDVPVIRIDMTGVKNAESVDWLRLYGTGSPEQNIWVEVDDVPKGIDVYNNADQAGGRVIMTDVVFVVDNSGSMSEEADAIARDIISWAQLLTNSGLSVQFGIVGYGGNVGSQYRNLVDGYGVSGALNMTSVESLSAYLNRATSTERTKGYAGSDAKELERYASASKYYRAGGECGAQAIRFADEYFNFRMTANKVYVNFTDDANYTGGNSYISVEYFKSDWISSQGTVHSVISNSKNEIEKRVVAGYNELPWLISEYTGGTTIFTSSAFTGVTLASLPVTGAMENSYIIRFTNIEELLDGMQHKVHITIRSKDGTVTADKVFYVIFGLADNH